MILLPFEPRHLVEMEIQETPDGVASMRKATLLKRGKEMMSGPGRTMFADDGRIVGCAGIKKIWSGVGEGWGVPSKIIMEHGRAVYDAVKQFLSNDCPEFHRIQAIVIDGFPVGEKFLLNLGFQYEGTLRKYGATGRDFKMFAVVR